MWLLVMGLCNMRWAEDDEAIVVGVVLHWAGGRYFGCCCRGRALQREAGVGDKVVVAVGIIG